MKTLLILALAAISGSTIQQQNPIDLSHWKLELPTGYTASDWKLSNFQNDKFCAPFFYLDSADGALVMEAYPAEGDSKATYTKTSLREQMQPGSSDVNWTLKQGGILETEFQVSEMSRDESGKYHRTILVQIDGRTTAKQNKQLGLEKSVSMPLLKIYWQNEKLRINRRVLKNASVVGDILLSKDAWEEDDGTYSRNTVDFEKVKLSVEVKRSKITIRINDEPPVVFNDISVSQWYFENYFSVGNYLQSKDANCRSVVKYFSLDVTH